MFSLLSCPIMLVNWLDHSKPLLPIPVLFDLLGTLIHCYDLLISRVRSWAVVVPGSIAL